MALIQRTPMKKKPQLVNSQQLFRDIFDHSPVAITVSDKNEKVIACNPFAAKMLGVSVKDILHRPVKELYPPKEWRRIRSLRIRRKGIAPHFETTVIRKDGSLLEVSVSIAVLKDATGAVTASIGIMRDISKRKMAEKKFKESENTMRIVLDNTAAAIMLIDQKERIVSWNPYTESLFGMKKKDLFHQPVSILYPPSEWETIRAANIRRLGAKHHLETQIITKQGKKIDVDLSVNVLKDANDAVVGSVGIIQDMSERKKTNDMLLKAIVAAEEANASKTAFLANMSHEVRTPMNAIIGMLDMTLDTPLNDEQQDNLKTAKDAADNLLNLLNDILDLSRI